MLRGGQTTTAKTTMQSSMYREIPNDQNQPPRLADAMIGRGGGEEKCCRICLEEDDPESMIAPCRCKGGSKWVHRGCLDLWRENEKDRAFAQCTECHFQYRFEDNSTTTRRQHRWRRAKFCLFVSRDICFVTIALQLVIGLLGFFIMLLDENCFGYALVDLLDGGKATGCHAGSSSSSTSHSSKNPASFLWCQHKLTAYYLCGFFGALVVLGIFGSTVLCRNKCRIPDLNETTNTADESRSTSLPAAGGAQQQQQQQQQQYPYASYNTNNNRPQSPSYVDHRTQYYRSRRRHRHRTPVCMDDDCFCCCYCPRQRGPPAYYYYNDCWPYYYCCDCGSTSDDCCCCCDGGGGSAGRGGNDSCDCDHDKCSGDGAHLVLMIMLVVLIILAVIGFFVGVFLGVIIVQRVLQHHMFRLQKRRLAEEFRIKDLAGYDVDGKQQPPQDGSIYEATPLPPPPPPLSALHPDDATHLQKLGLLVDDDEQRDDGSGSYRHPAPSAPKDDLV